MITGIVVVAVLVVITAIWRSTQRGRASAARYCTKHVITKLPGGPERLTWVYGPHRTPGNQCDGPEHRRSAWWW